MPRLIAYTHGRDDPAGRFRIAQYAPALRHAGWDLSLRPPHPERPWASPYRQAPLRWAHQRYGAWRRRLHRLADIAAAATYDAAFLSRDLLEGRRFFEQRLLAANARLVFDFDDAIFLEEHEAGAAPLGPKARHIGWICSQAAWVTVGNEFLASFARRYTDRVTVLPTVVDTGAYRMRAGDGTSGPVRLGWLGSDRSIRQTLFPHVAMLGRLQAELGYAFVVISRPRPQLPDDGLRWTFREWTPEVESSIADMFDIGIMPLVDTPYQRGKCGCKLIQYMAAGLPWVAPPVGVNRELAGGGHHGLLATTEAEWGEAIAVLAGDAALRMRMGRAGRAFVETHYSIERWFPELLDILVRVSGPRR